MDRYACASPVAARVSRAWRITADTAASTETVVPLNSTQRRQNIAHLLLDQVAHFG
jgi:hypothetical protein